MHVTRFSVAIAVALLAAVAVSYIAPGVAPSPSAETGASERLIVEADASWWMPWSLMGSADSGRVVYLAQHENKQFLVVDGVESRGYDTIQTFGFSPDGERVACAARVGDECFVVLDGVEGTAAA